MRLVHRHCKMIFYGHNGRTHPQNPKSLHFCNDQAGSEKQPVPEPVNTPQWQPVRRDGQKVSHGISRRKEPGCIAPRRDNRWPVMAQQIVARPEKARRAGSDQYVSRPAPSRFPATRAAGLRLTVNVPLSPDSAARESFGKAQSSR